jgi:hypothetical protein
MVMTALNSFGWCKGTVRAICEIDPDFPGYLMSQSLSERQLLVMILLAYDMKTAGKIPLTDLAKRIRTENKKRLLRRFIVDCPEGLFGVAGKIGGRIIARDRYLDLIDLLREPAAAKVLRHMDRIKPQTIKALKALEPVYRTPAIVETLEDEDTIQCARYVIAVAKRFRPAATDQEIARSFNQFMKSRDRQRREYGGQFALGEWLCQRLEKTSIPAPPWAGTDKLRPLTTMGQIRDAAAEFENCIAQRTASIITGVRYYYVFRGKVPAVVSIEHDHGLGWAVGEILGKQNRQVPQSISEEIKRLFRQEVGFGECQGWDMLGFS